MSNRFGTYSWPELGRTFVHFGSILAMIMLASCASVTAMQEPIQPKDVADDSLICPTKAEIDGQTSLAGQERADFRDEIIAKCIAAIDRRYMRFKSSLHRESATANLATDVLALGLTGGASVAAGATAQRLAAGSAFVLGSQKAINKDVFFDMTLPAIESSMDAKRATILAQIVNAQNSDIVGTRYSLARATYDLDSYEAAGNLYIAISELTKTASGLAEAAQKQVAQSQLGMAVVPNGEIFSDEVNTKLNSLMASVKALKEPADTATVDKLTAKLGVVPVAGASFSQKKAAVMATMQNKVTFLDDAKDIAAVNQLESDLKPILP